MLAVRQPPDVWQDEWGPFLDYTFRQKSAHWSPVHGGSDDFGVLGMLQWPRAQYHRQEIACGRCVIR